MTQNVFMFSGQGSQFFHMAANLRQHNADFAATLKRLAEPANEILGESLLDMVYDPSRRKSDEFSDPRRSNVALLTLQCALAQTLEQQHIQPDLVCGMSLGEYAAAVVAKGMSFETALQLVAGTGECFTAHCQPGAMLAVLDDVARYHTTSALNRNAELIFESPGRHFVLAGSSTNMAVVERHLRRTGVVFQALPVAYGYHSSNIDPARKAFEDIVLPARYAQLRLPMYSSACGGVLAHIDGAHLWRTARLPMRFVEAIEAIPERSDGRGYRFIDLGPTGTMANLVRHHVRRNDTSEIFAIVTPFGTGPANLAKLSKVAARLQEIQPKLVQKPATEPKLAHVFPGQGSQRRGMGGELWSRYPKLVARADAVLGYSITELCVKDPARKLAHTEYTQPALFVTNALFHHERLDQGLCPAYLAGHSLGEFSALYAAGGLDFETGLRLVQKRGAVMAQAQQGGMAAVIGLSEQRVRETIEREGLADSIQLANINSPSQVVLSGDKAAILGSQHLFEKAGCARYVPLNVSGAFHSRLMSPAADEFARFVQTVAFSPLHTPVIANVTALPYPDDDLATLLVEQITHPVRWTETIAYLGRQGVDEIQEIGPGHVLDQLTRACRQHSMQLHRNVS